MNWELENLLTNFEFELMQSLFLVILTFGAIFLGLKLIRRLILRNLKKLTLQQIFFQNLIALFTKIPRSFDYFLTFLLTLHLWPLPWPQLQQLLLGGFLILVAYRIITFLSQVVALVFETIWFAASKPKKNKTILSGLKLLAEIVLWSAGVLLVLANLGFNVNTLIASLGIGGIAVAFALQNILADLFNSFAIYFDQPFRIGDFVKIGNESGDIKKIGLKTTRITTLQGQELVIANSSLMSQSIHNFKRMRERRVNFGFGVEYGTTSQQLRTILEIVPKIIKKIPTARFQSCHFTEFGDFSLNFQVVYFVLERDFLVYRETQQEINLAIKAEFEKAQIEMAFPTQKILLAKNQT